MANQRKFHGTWASRWTFILAATGSAVGLGNIWKFPYITGENGGGAFVLVYLACILVVGIPIMVAEVLLGRRGRKSPINSMHDLTLEANMPKYWAGIGWMGVVAGLIILSYYSVIAGWALAYVFESGSGTFHGTTAETAGAVFETLLADKNSLITWHSVFMAMTLAVVIGGVTRGLGTAVRLLMPVLFLLLLALLAYGFQNGDFAAGARFLFSFNTDQLSWSGVLVALGHAFFTLSLGMGAIMAYGAYMPEHAKVGSTVLTIGGLDTVIALIAGLAIFPIVFAHPSLEPGQGPGLLFVSLPVAFGNMPGGVFFGTLFFVLVSVAAWSSAISLIEPGVAWLIETGKFNRITANLLLGGIAWFMGLGTVLSFNDWSGEPYLLLGMTVFDFLDFLAANILLPLGGLFIALFVGWVMKEAVVRKELEDEKPSVVTYWLKVLRFVAPVLVLVIFVVSLYDKILQLMG